MIRIGFSDIMRPKNSNYSPDNVFGERYNSNDTALCNGPGIPLGPHFRD